MLSSFQSFDHKGLVRQIIDITLWVVASFCLAYYWHLIDLNVMPGLVKLIQIG